MTFDESFRLGGDLRSKNTVTLARVSNHVVPRVRDLNVSERLIWVLHGWVLLHVTRGVQNRGEVVTVDEEVSRTDVQHL